MKLIELFEGRDAPLYHAYAKGSYALKALKDNQLYGTSPQRWWPNGQHHTDDEPGYQESYWMKGVSLTRDINYAKSWGNIVFILDQTKLTQNYKIIPFAWSKTMKNSTSYKKEREEYLILDASPETYDLIDSSGTKFTDVNRFTAPAKKTVTPLSKYLIGILIKKDWLSWDEDFFTSKDDMKQIKLLTNHPKFRGFY